jgi:hypothetical protein
VEDEHRVEYPLGEEPGIGGGRQEGARVALEVAEPVAKQVRGTVRGREGLRHDVVDGPLEEPEGESSRALAITLWQGGGVPTTTVSRVGAVRPGYPRSVLVRSSRIVP